jgi:hypothetical protein
MKRRAGTRRAMTTRTENTGPGRAEQSPPIPTEKMRARAEAKSSEGHFYKPLPKEFRRDGFVYRQIAREGNAAIYEQTRKGNEDSATLEVIRIRQRERFEIGGRVVAPAEIYPRSEAWGVDGFTLTKKDAAFRKFRELAGRKAVQ